MSLRCICTVSAVYSSAAVYNVQWSCTVYTVTTTTTSQHQGIEGLTLPEILTGPALLASQVRSSVPCED